MRNIERQKTIDSDKQRKSSLREEVLQRRDSVSESTRKAKESLINQALIEALDDLLAVRQDSSTRFSVAVYHAMKSEVSLHGFVMASYERDVQVCYPCMTKNYTDKMVFLAVDKASLLSKDEAGVPDFLANPLRRYALKDPLLTPFPLVEAIDMDLVVVPVVAFDHTNARLGYGGGNYDRFLMKLRPEASVVGVAFIEQSVERVPIEPHDIPLPDIVFA